MKLFINKILQYIFESLFIAFVLLFFAEYMKTGMVTNYLPYNYLLTLVIIFGIIIIAFGPTHEKKQEEKYRILKYIGKIFFSVILSLVCVIVIRQNISDLDFLGSISFISPIMPWIIGFGIFLSIFSILKNNK